MVKKGFTLIELLIVVAIIAILAAIAVPNFLEAQTRAKVSRTQADMRSVAVAIEAYTVDNNNPPPIVAPTSPRALGTGTAINGPSVFGLGSTQAISSRFITVTTPIAYITSVPRDPFISAQGFAFSCGAIGASPVLSTFYDTYDYAESASLVPGGALGGNRGASATSGANWHIVSAGPDGENCFGGGPVGNTPASNQKGVDYDPTNGTLSVGDIVRIGSGRGPLVENGPLPSIDRVQNIYNF